MRKTLIQRARELPMGLWTASQQFDIRHLVSDLAEAYRKVRAENRRMREEGKNMNRYKIFIDTEFNQNVDPVQLISIAIVTNDRRELYAVLNDFDESLCDDWLKKNVLPQLHAVGIENQETAKNKSRYLTNISRSELKGEIKDFLGDEKFDAWGYYADYDWYLFTRLFGSFMEMPKNFPQLCYDVQQFAHHRLISRVTLFVPEFQPEHNALVDARWTRAAFEYVQGYSGASLR